MNRRQLRHAHAGHDTRGANGTWADAHFDRVRTGSGQITCRLRGGDITADNLYFGEVFLHPFHTVEYALAVAVRGIDHNHVHACGHQRPDALFRVRTRADRCADAQTAFGIFVGIGEFGGFDDVFNRNQAFEFVVGVQDQNAFDFVLVHQFARFFDACAFGHGNQAFARGHDGGNRQVEAGFETQVAVGYDADHFAVFHDRQAGHFAFALRAQFQKLADKDVGCDGNGVFDHAAFMAFYLGYGFGLHVGGHVFMDDAQAAFLSHRNGQTGFGYGIHSGGKQGEVEGDLAGESGFEGNVARQHLGMGGNEQNVVEGVGFFYDAHDAFNFQFVQDARHCIKFAAPPQQIWRQCRR